MSNSVIILNKVGNVSNFSNEGNLNYIRAVIKKGKVRSLKHSVKRLKVISVKKRNLSNCCNEVMSEI